MSSDEVPKLTKQDTKKLFIEVEEKKVESLKKVLNPQTMQSGDPMEQMFVMMVE